MPGIGWQELLIVLVIVIIIFGVGKLPEIGGALGKGIREFRENTAMDDKKDDKLDTGADQASPTTTVTTTRVEEPVATTSARREVRADEI